MGMQHITHKIAHSCRICAKFGSFKNFLYLCSEITEKECFGTLYIDLINSILRLFELYIQTWPILYLDFLGCIALIIILCLILKINDYE